MLLLLSCSQQSQLEQLEGVEGWGFFRFALNKPAFSFFWHGFLGFGVGFF